LQHHTVLPYSKTDDSSSSRDNSIILDVISSRSASIDTVWKSVFLIIPKSAEWYLCNKTSDRQIKHFLEMLFLSRFFYFMSFWSILRWNRYVKVVYKCRTCENKFFSNFGELYLCNETSNRQNKICFGNFILFLFFVCYNFWF